MYVEYFGEFMEYEVMMCLFVFVGCSRRLLLFWLEGFDFDGCDWLFFVLL